MIIEWFGLMAIMSYFKSKKLILLALLIAVSGTSIASDRIERIDFEDAPVLNIVQTLARSEGLDIVIAGDPAGMQAKKATIHLRDILADQAIEYILRTNGLNYEKKGKVILVSTLPQDQAGSAYRGKVEVIRLKYISAEKAKTLLAKIEPALLIETGERANSLVLKGKDSEIEEALGLIGEIDRLAPQILIESKVMEISQNDSVKLGISYGNGTYRFQTSWENKKTSAAEALVSSLNALIANGSARVLANPKIATLDNQEAMINIGNRIPFAVPVNSGSNNVQWSVQYIDAGVRLKITPQLGSEGYITTFFQPEVSSISEWRTTAAGEFPVIATRNAAATVRVKDGETVVIGGLLSESDRENITRVPLLGYLPGIGFFFQNRSREKARTEIVFMITPHAL